MYMYAHLRKLQIHHRFLAELQHHLLLLVGVGLRLRSCDGRRDGGGRTGRRARAGRHRGAAAARRVALLRLLLLLLSRVRDDQIVVRHRNPAQKQDACAQQ